MAYNIIAKASAGSSDTINVDTLAIDTTGADLIVAAISFYGSVAPTLTDNKGNTFVSLPLYDSGGTFGSILLYKQSPIVGTSHTFSATVGGATYLSIAVLALSGSIASPFDVGNGNDGGGASSTTIQTGSVTPGFSNELVVAAISGGDSISSIDSGFTIQENVAHLPSFHVAVAIATLIQTSPASTNPTWTLASSTQRSATIASFKSLAVSVNEGRITQIAQEVIGGSPDANISQISQQIVGGSPNANVSQVTQLTIQQRYTDELTCIIVVQ